MQLAGVLERTTGRLDVARGFLRAGHVQPGPHELKFNPRLAQRRLFLHEPTPGSTEPRLVEMDGPSA